MPRIRLTTDRFDGLTAASAGDEIDVPAEEAARLLQGRMAEPLTTEPEHAIPARRDRETAARPRPKTR